MTISSWMDPGKSWTRVWSRYWEQWDQRKCQQQMSAAPARYDWVSADKPWCSGHQDSCSATIVCCTSRLISNAFCLYCLLYCLLPTLLPSTRLFAMCGRPLTRDTQTCGRLHELGWSSLVTRHSPQPSERVLICRAAKWSQYRWPHPHSTWHMICGVHSDWTVCLKHKFVPFNINLLYCYSNLKTTVMLLK